MTYKTLNVRFEEKICYIQFHRPKANNTINQCMVEELNNVIELCEDDITIIVLEGSQEVFCFGGDFQEVKESKTLNMQKENISEQLYDVWVKLATGPYITISHVRGRVNAGGVGFVVASDIVLADNTAQFSLSELLFGILPACVMPFLVRRIGFQKANYLTIMTQPVTAAKAKEWGIVDVYNEDSKGLLRKHLLRLKKLSKPGIKRYKKYMASTFDIVADKRESAIKANKEMFSDPKVIEGIVRFVDTGKFPWSD